jgi:hypothetical protein
MRSHLAAALLASLSTAACSQAAQFDGKWTGTMMGKGGGELGVELTIAQASGTWRFVPRGTQGRNNQCLGKEFPVAVTSQSEEAIEFAIKGASVLAGCIDQSAILKAPSASVLEGMLEDGRRLRLSRQ